MISANLFPLSLCADFELHAQADSPAARLALIHNPAFTPHAGVALDELEEVMGPAGRHATEHYERHTRTLPTSLGFQAGESGIVISGRVIGPFDKYAFQAADLGSLLAFELEQRIGPVVEAIASAGLPASGETDFSDLYALAGSVVQSANLPDPSAGMFAPADQTRRRLYQSLSGEHR